jgi:ankyrin repeat protein
VNEAERLRTELLFILKFPITAPTTPTISRSSPVGGKSQQTPAFPSERPPSKSPKKRGFKSPFSDVPENFQRALEAVETHGFGAIRWAEGWSALHWATQAGRPEICEWLLERGGDPQLADRKGKTPLGLAQELQETNVKGKQVLRLLAEAAGVDPAKEEKEGNLLTTMPTVQSGRVTATTTTTTTSNSIPSSRRENAFPNFPHLPEAYEEALRAIHRHGWSALKWSAGWSALHWAAQEGRLDVVKYLVDTAKAPVDITDKAGRQPIFYAARRGHSNVTVFLQSRGAKDVQGDVTPE